MSDETLGAALDPAAVQALLCGRRTVHDFLVEPVDDRVIVRALEAARWAPNHHRTEPWRFYLLGAQARGLIIDRNTAQLRAAQGERAAEVKRLRWQAVPGWLLLTCQRNADALREREDYAACCCAAQNFMLAAWAEGVGVKWTTGAVVRDDATLRALAIDAEAEFAVGLFWYGWPAASTSQQRRPLSDVLARRP